MRKTRSGSPLYAICSPNRWGLRYSDEDKGSDGNLVYPVARDHAKAILTALTNVQWGDAYFGKPGSTPTLKLTWPMDSDAQKSLFVLIKPIITAALTSSTAGFGIPTDAVPKDMGLYTPSLKSPPGEQGTFFPNYWSLYLNVTHFEPMFRIKSPAPASDTGSRDEQLTPLRIFADTLYHEARHCQQWFWIFAFVQQHADNFETTPNISKWPTDLVTNIANAVDLASAIVRLAENQSIPAEPTTLISLKRMAIGQYVYSLNSFRRSGTCPKFLPDAAALEDEYKRARASAIDLLQHVGIGGTAIDVDAMVAEPNRCYRDYTARPWENDAFVCGEMAAAYWRDDLGLGITTYAPEQCSRAYEHADENKKVADRLAALSAGGSGSTGSARGN
ncbi:hypothetical protein BSFA1_48410 [Burkholderia sp. SFA1]|nr:hypothetical protein BSFA1_48410 [Burkholderia sp. SFA1]